MYCRNCGKELEEGQKFCRNCGTPARSSVMDAEEIKGNITLNQPESSEVKQGQRLSKDATDKENIQFLSTVKTSLGKVPKKKLSKKTWGIIIVVCIVLAIGGALGGGLGNGRSSENESGTQQSGKYVIPRMYVEAFVNQNAEPANKSGLTAEWSYTENYDNSSHLSTVNIVYDDVGTYGKIEKTIQVIFLYDKSSDLWSVYQAGGWSKEKTEFNQNICKEWSVSDSSGSLTFTLYDLEKTSDGSYTLKISYDGYIVCDYITSNSQHAPFSGTASGHIVRETAYFNVQIPDGYKINSFYGTDKLSIWLSVSNGISNVSLPSLVAIS